MGMAGAVASQMAAMVVMCSLRGGPSWLGAEPLCLAISVVLMCPMVSVDGSHGCGLLSDVRRAVAEVVGASPCRLLDPRVGFLSKYLAWLAWVGFVRALG